MARLAKARSDASYRPLVERSLFVLALLGILLTVHLAFWYGGRTSASDPVCGAGFDCQAVLASDPALLGVSSTYWGMLFYIAVAGMGIGLLMLAGRAASVLYTLRRLLIGAGLLYSAFLTALQYLVLSDRCLLCLISAAIVACMTAVLVLERRIGSAEVLARARELRLRGVLGALALVFVVADYAYSGSSSGEAEVAALGPAEAADTSQCIYDPDRPYFANFERLVEDYDPIVGRPDAPVTIVEFLDPNCNFCKDLHPVMQRLLSLHSDNARIVYKPVTLVGGPSHSLDEVMALWLAEESGRFEEMMELQFRHQNGATGLSVDRLTEFADDIGMNAGRFREDLLDGRLAARARRVMQIFNGLGLTGVPAVIIDGRLIHHSARSIGCLNHFVEQAVANATSQPEPDE